MTGYLYQVTGDGIEELYHSEKPIDGEIFQGWWREYQETDYEDFEEFMGEVHPSIDLERVFLDEIYV